MGVSFCRANTEATVEAGVADIATNKFGAAPARPGRRAASASTGSLLVPSLRTTGGHGRQQHRKPFR